VVRLIDERLGRLVVRLAGVALVLLAVLAPLAWRSTRADRIDRVVATAVYSPPSNPARSAALIVMQLGSPVAVLALAGLAALVTWRRFRDPLLAAFSPIAVAVALLAEWLVKQAVQRHRPSTAAVAHQGGVSFPSGHATGASALAFAAVLLLVAAKARQRRVVIAVLLLYAGAVGAARMVIGVHYLSDVIAGVALAMTVVSVVGWICTRVDDPPPSKWPDDAGATRSAA